MNRAAQELAYIGVAKRREKVLAAARQLCVQGGFVIPPALNPPLLLTERLRG